jgi:hypothetical protein
LVLVKKGHGGVMCAVLFGYYGTACESEGELYLHTALDCIILSVSTTAALLPQNRPSSRPMSGRQFGEPSPRRTPKWVPPFDVDAGGEIRFWMPA